MCGNVNARSGRGRRGCNRRLEEVIEAAEATIIAAEEAMDSCVDDDDDDDCGCGCNCGCGCGCGCGCNSCC